MVRTEDRTVRKELENARAIAANATSAVNVLVDMKAVGVDVFCSGSVVSDIRKRGFLSAPAVRAIFIRLSQGRD